MKQLTNREEEIMTCLWENGPSFVKDILKSFPEPRPHYNTVSTIVRGLEEKGFIDHEQYGNTHRYYAAISKEEFSKGTVKDLIVKYFNKSYKNLVSAFVEDNELSIDEIKDLIQEVKQQKSKNE